MRCIKTNDSGNTRILFSNYLYLLYLSHIKQMEQKKIPRIFFPDYNQMCFLYKMNTRK